MFYKMEVIDGESCIKGLTEDGLRYNRYHQQMPEFPLEFDGLPVTRIGEYAFCDKGIKRLPESWGNITAIENMAFVSNKISDLPTDWGIVSEIGDCCFAHNYIKTIPDLGIMQEIGELAFHTNEIEQINGWGDLRVIKRGAFLRNSLSGLTASFRNIKIIEGMAFASNNILEEIGDMYMVPQVASDVFVGNPGDGILYAKYLKEGKHYRRATGN